MDLVTSDSEQANKYSNNPLVELKAWQRFHIRLTALYGGTVFLALSLLGVIFYNTGVNYELASSLQQETTMLPD